MSANKRWTPQEEERLLDELAASIETESAVEIGAEMKEAGHNLTDVAELMKAAALAGVKQFGQSRPQTLQEREVARIERATSRVQSLLASLRGAGDLLAPRSFAPAYRNKQEETPASDEELLRQQQENLDRKSK